MALRIEVPDLVRATEVIACLHAGRPSWGGINTQLPGQLNGSYGPRKRFLQLAIHNKLFQLMRPNAKHRVCVSGSLRELLEPFTGFLPPISIQLCKLE